MKIGENSEEKSFKVFATRKMMQSFIDQFLEKECEVPNIVLLLFDPTPNEIQILELMRIKTILTPSHEEILDMQIGLLTTILDDCEKSVAETLQNIEIDLHHRFEALSDTLYNKIYLYDGYIPPAI